MVSLGDAIASFVISGGALVLAASFLVRFADQLSWEAGLGRLWTGSVLVAGATSLPELTTDLSAVQIGAPDLAVGDLLGSSLANMLILAIADLAFPSRRVLQELAPGHALTASLAILLTALVALFLMQPTTWQFLHVGVGPIMITLVYLLGIRTVFLHQRRGEGPTVEDRPLRPVAEWLRVASIRQPLLGFMLAAILILIVAPQFARAAKNLATVSGLGMGFVGTTLVGLSTSLPELVATLSAVRMGAFDLAIGNVFGSNAFNMVILLPLDLASGTGPILALVKREHILTATFAIVLMSLGLAAVVYRSQRRYSLIEPTSLLMAVVYVLGLILLYQAGF